MIEGFKMCLLNFPASASELMLSQLLPAKTEAFRIE